MGSPLLPPGPSGRVSSFLLSVIILSVPNECAELDLSYVYSMHVGGAQHVCSSALFPLIFSERTKPTMRGWCKGVAEALEMQRDLSYCIECCFCFFAWIALVHFSRVRFQSNLSLGESNASTQQTETQEVE